MLKKMIIMRGLSGSGKTYTAKNLAIAASQVPSVCCFSAADFLDDIPQDLRTRERIRDSHQLNRARVAAAMLRSQPLVIVDNTHIRLWELVPWLDLAAEYTYAVSIAHSAAPWRFNVTECALRNDHDLGVDIIQKQMSRWEYWNPANISGLHTITADGSHCREVFSRLS